MPPSADSPVTDDALFEAFVSIDLPADQFHHEQHVRVPWLFVGRRFPDRVLVQRARRVPVVQRVAHGGDGSASD